MNNHASQKKRFNELLKDLSQDDVLIHVSKLLERAFHLWPKRKVVICGDESITYKELYYRSQLLAKELQEKNVHTGDRVILFFENSIEFYIAYFAIWQAGAIVTPLNVFLTEHELVKIIEEVEPKIIIISEHLKERLNHYTGKLPELITSIDKTSRLPRSITPVIHEPQNVHNLAALLYTSGTTGFPKGVMLSSYNIVMNALQGTCVLDFEENERIFCPMPLFHSLPQNVCMWSTVLVGATAIIVPKIERKTLLKGISKKPTIVVAVPALYGLFCILRPFFSNVKYFASGGDALSDKIRSYFALIYRRKICNGYGLTETSPFISADIDDYTKPTSTIGHPLVNVSCEIRDDHGKTLAQGQIGTLWVSGPNIMLGYYKAEEATHAILKHGWLNTGDLAYLTPDGQIVLAGRARDLISNKGLKIYPQEVENVLLSHTLAMQVAVLGIKTEQGEEIPVAFIATKDPENKQLTAELRALCQRNLAAYKIPRTFYLRKELPTTTTGKVDKKKLRAEIEH